MNHYMAQYKVGELPVISSSLILSAMSTGSGITTLHPLSVCYSHYVKSGEKEARLLGFLGWLTRLGR